MAKQLGSNGLSLEAYDCRFVSDARIKNRNWFYTEEPVGLVVTACASGSAVITKSQLRAYLKRLDAGKEKKR